jgi:hypothetical protein
MQTFVPEKITGWISGALDKTGSTCFLLRIKAALQR